MFTYHFLLFVSALQRWDFRFTFFFIVFRRCLPKLVSEFHHLRLKKKPALKCIFKAKLFRELVSRRLGLFTSMIWLELVQAEEKKKKSSEECTKHPEQYLILCYRREYLILCYRREVIKNGVGTRRHFFNFSTFYFFSYSFPPFSLFECQWLRCLLFGTIFCTKRRNQRRNGARNEAKDGHLLFVKRIFGMIPLIVWA